MNQTLTLILFCVFLLYPWITLQLLQFGICLRIDGKYYLLADMSELCFEGQWLANLGPVIALFLLLSVGIPVTLGSKPIPIPLSLPKTNPQKALTIWLS